MSLLMNMGRSYEADRSPSAMVNVDAVMLAVTLLFDRDLGLRAPGVPARDRRFVNYVSACRSR
jgi:hypothetical protein